MKTTFETETSTYFKKALQLSLPALTLLTPIALLFASIISGLSLPALMATLFSWGIYPIIWIAEAVITLLMPLPSVLILIGATIFSIAASCILAGLIGGILIGGSLWAANYFYDMTRQLLSSLITDSKILDMVSFAMTALLITPGAFLSVAILGAPLVGIVCYSVILPTLLILMTTLPALPMILLITGIGLLGCASLLLGGTAALVAVGYAKTAVDSLDNETDSTAQAPEVQETEMPDISPGLKKLGAVMESAEPSEAPKETAKIFADHAEKREEQSSSLLLEDAALNM
ncbi:hypothetical protein [Legionella shakespearei]|uniref:Transmembrane protein n=1 Tax=Legionella shakespearei DSM 23087 TaxID=1122169 RepID=A0A0W0ZB36_9GAMM|nr:hypothetical protein [Legionella shakespearei]KTD65974.1 hypothetical protein Lsha_0181 [Legionella shakespearei DSM 23087]